MQIQIPTAILEEVNEQINQDPNFFNLKEKYKHKLLKASIKLWLFIYDRQINDDKIFNLKGYTNINKKELDFIDILIEGKRYRYSDIIGILSMSGVISVNDRYSIGKFSKSIRIETSFIKSNYTEINLDFDKLLFNCKDKSYWLNKYPEQYLLIEDAYNTNVNLDKYIPWLSANIGSPLKPVIKNGRVIKRNLTEERAYYHLFLALKVNMKNLWFKLSDEGRFYSSLSNLPSGSIQFLKLYGQETVAIDVKNCQPLLLSLLINNKNYSIDTQNGEFYSKVSNELNCDVDKFKILSYKHIFFNSNALKSGKIYNAMEKLYSGIMEQINNLKTNECLARKLQKVESDIFVKRIGKINIHKVLRHDEVIVVINNRDLMVKWILKEFKKFKLEVKVKVN